MNPQLLHRFPAISDLQQRTKRRLPYFSWEYLDSGTGAEHCVSRNISALQEITFLPRLMKGEHRATLDTELFGVNYKTPFGIAPVGLTGLMWPGIEKMLAKTAANYGIPYCLSTVATETPETIGPLVDGMGWFQLYPPNDRDIRRDLLARYEEAGFTTLVITADTSAQSQRERQKRAGVSVPPKHSLKTYLSAAMCPAWSLSTLKYGLPRFRTMEKYVNATDIAEIGAYMNANMGTLDYQYLEETRNEWSGPMLIKGILSPSDARQCIECGADGVIVSNHGGRQFDGAPAAIDALPAIVNEMGKDGKVLFDSGIRGGLDVCRALALGADFVLLGRAFIYGAVALGQHGSDHVADLMTADMNSNLANLGCTELDSLSTYLDPRCTPT
jgi:L-lactate dehydrogenase (cytochrome)